MKKLLIASIATLTMIFAGCDNKPTPEVINLAANGIGISAGLVANQIKTTDKEKATVIEIINIINSAAPTVDQTFSAAWTPIVDTYLTEYINSGKLDETSKNTIMLLFSTSVETLEFVIYSRYPAVKNDVALSGVVIRGFCAGFSAVYKTTDVNIMSMSTETLVHDKEAYEYQMNLLKDLM